MKKLKKQAFRARLGFSNRALALFFGVLLLMPLLAGTPIIHTLFSRLVPDANFWYGYMNYAGTVILAFVALFVIHWQDIINNKKKLMIVWKHALVGSKGKTAWHAVHDADGVIHFDSIKLELINVGNRRIRLLNIAIEVPKNGPLIPVPLKLFPDSAHDKLNAELPYLIDIEEVIKVYIPLDHLYQQLCFYLHQGKLREADTIKVTVEDVTGQTFTQDTTMACRIYLERFRKMKPDVAKEIWADITTLPRLP